MKFITVKYFSTLIVFALALLADGWMWNYYMQSPWTRDGKVRAELVDITPHVRVASPTCRSKIISSSIGVSCC